MRVNSPLEYDILGQTIDQATFEKLLGFGNHLMLFSEDIDEKDGSQWGNFPQAYSHVGLMNAAYRIAQKLDKPSFLMKQE